MNHPKPRSRVILRSLALGLVAVVLTVTVLAASELFFGELVIKKYPDGVPPLSGELRALTVRTQDNADFPSAPGLATKVLQTELEELVAFAESYGYNALLFEASPEGDAFWRSSILPSSAFWTGEQGKFTFFDPLDYLVNICKEKNIQVYALIDPFDLSTQPAGDSPAGNHPDWVSTDGRLDSSVSGVQKLIGQVTDELTDYDIAGVVVEHTPETPEALAKTLAQAHDAIRQKDAQRLGMLVDFGAIDPASDQHDLLNIPLTQGDLDFIVPFVADDAADDVADYTAKLAAWDALCKKNDAAWYPMHAVNDTTAFAHSFDNKRWHERDSGAGGTIINNYGNLNTEARTAAYSIAASFAQLPPAQATDFSYPQTLAITRPTQTLTTSYENYFITGTSDPAKPLVHKDKELARSPETGLWGTLVKVNYGENSYTFSQGGVSKSVTIVRSEPSGAVSTIDAIQKRELYPTAPEVVLADDLLKLSCIAPAGGTVTATVGGLTETLEPVAAANQNGVAVTYQAELDLSSLAVSGQVKKLGPVTYHLNYAGMNSTQDSAGEVYVTGDGVVPVAKMKAFTPISATGKDDGDYATTLKTDCVVEIAENPRNNFYKLATGGFVSKANVDILEGAVTAENHVTALALERVPKGEKITLTGTARPYFSGELTDGVLTVTLQKITGFEKLNAKGLESVLCTAIESEIAEDGSATLRFTLAPDVELLGWDVQFQNNDTIIYLREKPKLHTDSARPLTDFTILVDPGHGGTDPGALGIPGESGPMEKQLNLANAYALKSRLEALGAQVHLTQEDQSFSLNERIDLAETLDADLFISTHHNSLGENVDSNDVSGVEVYYFNDQSQSFAEQIGALLMQDTGRKLRWAQQSYYRVTMMSARPSVLIESGFICNPSEYEEITDEFAMYRYGIAVADAVLTYFA